MHIDITTAISMLAGVGIPFLVDLVTKSSAAPGLKSAIATALSVLAGVLTTVAYHADVSWQVYLYNVGYAYALAFVTHYTGATGIVQRSTATVGVGKPRSNAFNHRGTSRTRPAKKTAKSTK